MSWSSLPDDLVREILGKLSLIELAPIFTTCSSFRAAYCEIMAGEQEARHQLAVNRFGPERIACLCALIMRLINGEPLGPSIHVDWNRSWISADGVLQPGSLPQPSTPRDMDLYVHCCGVVQRQAHQVCNFVRVHDKWGCSWRDTCLCFKIHHLWRRVVVDVGDDGDHMPAALMQVLLSGGLANSILDGKFQTDIYVGGSGMQIAPLLPFASSCKPAKTITGEYVWQHMRIGGFAVD